jgi:hypothetical protein
MQADGLREILATIGVLVLAGSLFAGAASAQAPSDSQRAIVDRVLMHAVLERGSFLACARLDSTPDTRDTLVQGWKLDIQDAGTILRAIGFTDAEVNALEDRYDIEKAAPQFADLKALAAYCSVIGDWKTRWARLQILLPQAELRRQLRP